MAADVERYPFEADFDLCFPRFGMMFFEDPVNAMRNIHSALKPGGELKFIVWRDIADNPWLGMAKDVVPGFLPPPGEHARTCGPGPFSMSDPEVVTKQLEIAGFEEIEVERIDGPVTVGDSVEDAMEFQLALGAAVAAQAGSGACTRGRLAARTCGRRKPPLALLVCYGGLAALAVVVSSRRHRSATIPLTAIAGAGMVGYVLFVDYHMIIELSGFGLLALAVWLDCRRRRRSESRVPGLETHG